MARVTWAGLGLRPMFFTSAAGLVGGVVGPMIERPWGWWLLGAALFLAIAAWRGARPFGTLSMLAGALCTFATLASLEATPRLPEEADDGQPHTIEGVVERAAIFEHREVVSLRVEAIDGREAHLRLDLTLKGERHLLKGQRLLAVTGLRERRGAANPGEWSRQQYLARRAGGFVGSTRAQSVVVLEPAGLFERSLATARARVRGLVDAAGLDPRSRALVLTLAAGDRAELSSDTEEVFSASGLAHVLSVSGLHVAALALALFRALRFLLVRLPWRGLRRHDMRQLAAPLAVPLVWAYVAFTGWQAPAERSAVMVSVVLFAQLVLRRSDALNALCLAVLGLLAVDPAAPFNLSVQLSFTAVLALVTLGPALRAVVPVPRPSPAKASGWRLTAWRLGDWVLETFIASLAVTVASAPLIAAVFQRVSLAGLVSNVVALPVCGALVLVCAAGVGLAWLSAPLATGCFMAAGALANVVLRLAEVFAAVPYATVWVPELAWWVAPVMWSALGLWVLGTGRWRWVGLVAPAVAALAVAVQPAPPPLEVAFLSVGHGDAIVVSAGGRHAIIDAGGVPEGADTGLRFVLPFLRQRGIERLELAVLTHAHPDHALGLISTLEAVPTKRLWLPRGTIGGGLVDDVEDAAGEALVEHVGRGAPPFRLGEAVIEVLSPTDALAGGDSENDRSIVLSVSYGATRFLLTGDIEAPAEAELDLGKVTVVKAPHHGSRTSSTERLVAATRPELVVFSVGHKNRYGFPHPEVVERYEAVGARVLRTDLDGAVMIASDGRRLTVQTFESRSGPRFEARRRRPGQR